MGKAHFALGCAGVALTAFFLAWIGSFPHTLDPDRFFHFALWTETVRQGVWWIHSWNAFPLLGWHNFFIDKEFLFHLLLRPVYVLAGERAVLLTTASAAALALWLPYFLLRPRPYAALALSLVLCLSQPLLLFRYSLMRPYVLALLFFLCLVFAVLRKKPLAAALAILGYTLAYHAFYVPVCFLACVFLVDWWSKEEPPRAQRQLLLLSAGGLLAGVLLNPYFPGNILAMLQHLALAVRPTALQQETGLQLGIELHPIPPLDLLRLLAAPLLTLALGSVFIYRRSRAGRGGPTREEKILALAGIGLLFAAVRSPRALEFAFPLWALFAYFSLLELRPGKLVGVLALIFVIQLSPLLNFSRALRDPAYHDAPDPQAIATLLEPIQTKYGLVFHDNWALGAYLVYIRPSGQAIDVLDPTFLLIHNAPLARLRVDAVRGLLRDPARAIHHTLGAKYVVCEPSPLCRQLEQTPSFHLLRSTPDGRFRLFAHSSAVPKSP